MLDLSNLGKKKEKIDYGRVEDGIYPARVVRIIDLGIVQSMDFQTKELETWPDGNPKMLPKIWVDFELPTETINIDGDDKPRWYGREYTISNHEKAALNSFVKATGCGADLTAALGKPVMVQIGSTVSNKAKVVGVTVPMKGLVIPELVNDTFIFDMENPTEEGIKRVPRFLQERIVNQLVAQGRMPETAPTVTIVDSDITKPQFDDDVPF